MTTQNNVSNPIAVVPVRPFSWPLALAILALGLILGVFATNLVAAINKSEVASVSQGVSSNLLAPIATQAETQRAREAEAARYNSLGLFYAAGNEAERQQAIAAEAARYSGLAEWGRVPGESHSLVWPPRPTQFQPIINPVAHGGVQHDREYGLAAFGPAGNESRSLAWPPRPTQFYPARETVVAPAETGLAQYHQSEWGHRPQVETNSNGDTGFMEFSTK